MISKIIIKNITFGNTYFHICISINQSSMKITYYTVSVTTMATGETKTKAFFREKSAIKHFYKLCNNSCYSAYHLMKPDKNRLQYALAGGPGYDMMFEINYNYLYL
jgi:hypothetical protein